MSVKSLGFTFMKFAVNNRSPPLTAGQLLADRLPTACREKYEFEIIR